MAAHESFEAELEERLEARRLELEEHDLGVLKQHFRQMRSSFEAVHNVLKKKGLLKEDPYKYEERVSELSTPSDAQYLDSDRDTQLSIRLGQYESRLAFLTDYFDCSLENLTLRNLKEVVKFVKYINWRNVSENATQPTTRGVGEQLVKVKRGADTLSANIVTDAQDQLSRASRDALAVLKRITGYQREMYKLEARRTLFTDPRLSSSLTEDAFEQAARTAKSIFSQHMPGRPFARDLILEIFAENNPNGGEAVRKTLLDELAVSSKPEKEKKGFSDLKPMLLEAVRTIASSSRSLEEAVRKLTDNALVLDSRKISFAEMMRRIWERLRGHDNDQRIYTVEYIDSTTNARKTEEINFDQFAHTVTRRARVYSGLMSKSGPAWSKLSATDEDGLLQFVTKDTQELYEVVRRMEALDTFFRTEVPREQRAQLRGINIETTTINDALVRTRKKTRQYVAKIEEREQLRRLGITEG